MISNCYLIEPFTCTVNDKIADVAKKLQKYAQRHIYVVEGEKPVGIISISDIMDKIVIAGKNAADFKAKDVMNKNVLVFQEKDEVKKAYKAMTDKGVVSCVVVEKGKMVGTLSLKEAVRSITDPENIKL